MEEVRKKIISRTHGGPGKRRLYGSDVARSFQGRDFYFDAGGAGGGLSVYDVLYFRS